MADKDGLFSDLLNQNNTAMWASIIIIILLIVVIIVMAIIVFKRLPARSTVE